MSLARTTVFALAVSAIALVHCVGADPEAVPAPDAADGGDADGGASGSRACALTDRTCVGRELRGCAADGSGFAPTPLDVCATEALCTSGLAGGKCTAPACAVGDFTCDGADRLACLADRTGFATTKTESCSGAKPACAAGACVECVTGAKDCTGKTPETCVANAWQKQAVCGGSAIDSCAGGDCVDIRFARWPMPNEPLSSFRPAKLAMLSANVARDEVTGLEWQRAASATPIDVQGGGVAAYCQGLILDGRGGWHAPSVPELVSLLDFSKVAAPFLDATAFTGTPAGGHVAYWPGASWPRVNFDTHTIDKESVTGGSYQLRCVRNPKPVPPAPRYTINAGEVTDNWTKLVWQQTKLTGGYTQGVTACANLGGGYRMPTVKEVYTLFDPTAAAVPYIDATAFPAPGSTYDYWSSTVATGGVWAVRFAGVDPWASIVVQGTSGNMGYTRCVK